jgi:hypothetical protein
MLTMCSQCWEPLADGDVIDCACGMPFCISCYDEHVWDCQEARKAMGLELDEEPQEDWEWW